MRVSRACDRCRKQKLKCDASRPCTLCTRTDKPCTDTGASKWKSYKPHNSCPTSRLAGRKRHQPQTGSSTNTRSSASQSQGILTGKETPNQYRYDLPRESEPCQMASSSSTMALVEGAFRSQSACTPDRRHTDAIPGMQSRSALQNNGVAGNSREQDLLVEEASIQSSRFISRPNSPLGLFWNTAQSSIPSFEAASLLVDTYFDRAHWFMLLFHQDNFRRRWPTLYDDFDPRSKYNTSDIGLMSTFIMVIAIGLHYAGDHRRQLLQSYGVVPNKLKDGLIDIVQHHLLTILSLQSLEAVQTCVLLGTHFLFHGSPALAWPICGCGLRVAQALNLHRQEARFQISSTSPEHLKHIEANKRCWWAIYEIETFCSMSYGYPHGIKDEDCDVQPLDPSAKLPSPQSPASFNEPLRCETTLLSYKYFMSKLSVILKEILTQLYGTDPHTSMTGGLDSFPIQPQRLIDKARELDSKLRQWSSEIPKELHLKVEAFNLPAYESLNELDRDIGASGSRFETHIFQLQSLNLWLAYENATILIHRPLLSYRLIPRELSNDSYGSDPFRSSYKACRDAALRTSQIASMPILDLASNTYAATFIGIHTFASGLTLGILSSMELFTPSSLQMKLGLQNLLSVQMKLKERSDLSAQGLDLLKRLIKNIMDKELNAMLDPSKAITPRLILDDDCPRDIATSDIQSSRTFEHTETDLNNCRSADASKDSQTESQSYEFVDDPENLGSTLNLDCMPDSSFLEALSDFDKVLFSREEYMSLPDLDLGSDGSFQNGVGALDQAWIWGIEGNGLPG